ncbi:Hypothetical predicted protein [Lecanosticta acicola]|uniref:Kazal-like domain-containing protein n=1 Tax=Lecanosticta acicola TaxID=111012 RepID=A0AAI8YSX3_9PEZI|nr:Hypothetical predicted protein [Lecanosticta acicola]
MLSSFSAVALLLLPLAHHATADAQRGTAVIVATPPPASASAAAQVTYQPVQSLPPASDSNFVYSTPTTRWSAPSFPTASPLPVCSEDMCPALNGQRCQDSSGATYGVLCDQRFSGTIITSSGKHKMEKMMVPQEEEGEGEDAVLAKRNYAGTLAICLDFCEQYTAQRCVGVDYTGGYCKAYSNILGTLSAGGQIAMVRQS